MVASPPVHAPRGRTTAGALSAREARHDALAEERLNLPLRLRVLQWSLAAVFLVLATAFWYFQVARHQQFLEMAENNHQRALPLAGAARRALRSPRHGAGREPLRLQHLDRPRAEPRPRCARRTPVAQLTGAPVEAIDEALERSKRLPAYRPTVVLRDATEAQIAAVAAHRLELPGVVVEKVPTRRYPPESMAAHLIGYVGEVTDAQLARPEYKDVQGGAVVGQAGVEQTYNPLLMGADGARHVVVNSRGREIDVLGEEEPVEGRRLQLTIDADVQRAAEEALPPLRLPRRGHRAGAVDRRGAGPLEPAGLRPQRLRRRHRTRRSGTAC